MTPLQSIADAARRQPLSMRLPFTTRDDREGGDTSERLRRFVQDAFGAYPFLIEVRDWTGKSYTIGKNEPHWSGRTLAVNIKTETAGRDLLELNGMRFLERFLEGEVDLEGNLYTIAELREHSRMHLTPMQLIERVVKDKAFQSKERARVSVKSHYDIPQEALNVYLDRKYMSYSCAMFEDPTRRDIEELKRIGQGEHDDFDSLEKAQWRKFADAADFIAPREGETLLDVGCGYGGQIAVALERHPFSKVVGWTHSHNQVMVGREQILAGHDPSRYELHEGDYREDERVFDHITSTGMISHVGPRGLVPYVRQVRKRIKRGGRYLHHALMRAHHWLGLDFHVGIAFNKKYVWPGFHWFTVGEHVRALEKNGFQVLRMTNLSQHYAKTTTAWYERMMHHQDTMIANLGTPTFRAWQIFLAGITGGFLNKRVHVYRLYCEAV